MKLHKGIWLPDTDTHFAAHLDKGPIIEGAGTYQHAKLETAVSFCKSRRVAVDVGAHVGLWSRVLAMTFDTILAFEPVPEHIECFKKNLVLPNGRNSRVHLFPVALGAVDSQLGLAMKTVPDNSGNAHIITHGTGLAVKVRKLDNYILNHHLGVDFIKIDTEGFELEVIKGAKETILQHKPVMIVEQKPGNGMRYGVSDHAAVDLLLTWGYREAWCKSGDHCLVWK